jgi:hypothetical protein
MKRDIKKQVEKARELQLAKKERIYSNDYQMRNFTGHLEELAGVRNQLIEEVEKLTIDIKQCVDIIQARQKELNKEHELIDNIRPE